MNSDEVKRMELAYGLLYRIENSLRYYIEQKMKETYGSHWHHIAPRVVLKRPPERPLSMLLFHEYERVYLRTYSLITKEIKDDF